MDPANQRALISRVQRFSVDDGPGIRTTVFFAGCNLRCLWCHNPECMLAGTPGVHSPIQVVDRNRLLEIASRDLLFYKTSGGGVTVSGGEPLLQPEFVNEFCACLRSRGIHTAVDTAGNVPWEIIKRASDRTDLILYDVKAITPELHMRVTGSDNSQILHNLQRLCALGISPVIRVPVIPGINTGEEMARIADFLDGLKGTLTVELLPYHRFGVHKYHQLGVKYPLEELPVAGELENQKQLTYFQGIRHFVNLR